MKKNTSRTKNNYRKAIRTLFRFGREKNYLPREATTEAEFTTSYDLGSEEILQLQEIGDGGGSEEMVRDHARQGEVERNPRRYRRWPLRASNLPGPLSRNICTSLPRGVHLPAHQSFNKVLSSY